jgi:uncharacterized membrane protein
MESKVKLFGHAAHPVLIVFPLGLLATAAIFDAIYLMAGNQMLMNAAYWMIAAGIVGGLLAALFGWIDWFAIPAGTRAKNVGFLHGIGNVVVLVLFAGSWWLRRSATNVPDQIAYALSFGGVGLALLTGWLGGELVGRLGVGVDDGANLNAPSSLSSHAAREKAQQVFKS